MNGAELVQLTEAARAFGRSDEVVRGFAEPVPDEPYDAGSTAGVESDRPNPTSPAEGSEGGLEDWPPPAEDDGWSLPNRALVAIAESEGWPLDLTGAKPRSPIPDQLSRYVSETLAAHAAVVMAKTQATAARAEADSANRKMRQALSDLDVTRTERERADALLAESRAMSIELDKQRAVAEARTEELRNQLEHERLRLSQLSHRVGQLEADRERLRSSLTWFSRRRLQRAL